MKLVWKGEYPGEEGLTTVSLPEYSVPLDGPTTLKSFIEESHNLATLPMILFLLAMALKTLVFGHFSADIQVIPLIAGAVFGLLCFAPYSLLGALFYPAGAQVEVWKIPKKSSFYIASTLPMSKNRYLLVLLLPSLLFGLLPLVLWVVLPASIAFCSFLLPFSLLILFFSLRDLYTCWLLIHQVRGNPIVTRSGWPIYWQGNAEDYTAYRLKREREAAEEN